MKKIKNEIPLNEQIKRHSRKTTRKKKYDGSLETVVSTGSTLLDLAISGGRIRGGGIPTGILMEIFGPSGAVSYIEGRGMIYVLQ